MLRSLFQGEHLGVEFALTSHEVLLECAGLLQGHTRIEGSRSFPVSVCWDALVIDDYFCLSSERLASRADHGFAWTSLETARKVDDDHELLEPPEKDVAAATTVKAAEAEIRSDYVRRGFVPVAAPIAKSIGLSVISLRAAGLDGMNAGLVSRLAGNWVSVLQFRKVWSSLIDDLFLFGAQCQAQPDQVFQMPRKVA